MNGRFLSVAALLLLSAFVWGQDSVTESETSTCTTSSASCLSGMIVTSSWVKTGACSSTITLTFTKVKNQTVQTCDISNFVIGWPGRTPPQNVQGCVADHDWGYNKQFCETQVTQIAKFGDTAYKFDTGGGCSGTYTVSFDVTGGSFVESPIVLKGGTDCQVCQIKSYVPSVVLDTCSTDSDCDDDNACTIDSCGNEQCGANICKHTTPDMSCVPCKTSGDCSEIETDACGMMLCPAGKCVRSGVPNCAPCQTPDDCPALDPAYTCSQRTCENGVCGITTVPDCCESTTTNTTDGCVECVKKYGCGFDEISSVCRSLNSTTNAEGLTTSCYKGYFGDGDGGDGDGLNSEATGGIIAASVIAGLAGLAALAGIVVAAAAIIARVLHQKAIAAKLAAVGFTADEIEMITNNATYEGMSSGNSALYISTNDMGDRVLHVGGGLSTMG